LTATVSDFGTRPAGRPTGPAGVGASAGSMLSHMGKVSATVWLLRFS
jgi:hypothetical protein